MVGVVVVVLVVVGGMLVVVVVMLDDKSYLFRFIFEIVPNFCLII